MAEAAAEAEYTSLSDFLDTLPRKPCEIKPQNRYYCTVCERLNKGVATRCKNSRIFDENKEKTLAEDKEIQFIKVSEEKDVGEEKLHSTITETNEKSEKVEFKIITPIKSDDDYPLIEFVQPKDKKVEPIEMDLLENVALEFELSDDEPVEVEALEVVPMDGTEEELEQETGNETGDAIEVEALEVEPMDIEENSGTLKSDEPIGVQELPEFKPIAEPQVPQHKPMVQPQSRMKLKKTPKKKKVPKVQKSPTAITIEQQPQTQLQPQFTPVPTPMKREISKPPTPQPTTQQSTIRQPQPTMAPKPTKQPRAIKQPQPTMAPKSSKQPRPIRQPQPTMAPKSSKQPRAIRQPQPTMAPKPSKQPRAIRQPQPTMAPKPSKQPRAIRQPKTKPPAHHISQPTHPQTRAPSRPPHTRQFQTLPRMPQQVQQPTPIMKKPVGEQKKKKKVKKVTKKS